ncbi:APO protein 3, mitochondrial [Cucumis sativus]|uniref:APO domain-containing protein n=1 Tax=Cucumis sativus TaxID=3659 RepID=A0A0A0K7T0_CUCSA|nr:APO protein 3, mitochondrial [Cucumis sativus]XP_031744740.1 APO protein 3, mitochondrial [Cucumis sativus]
MFCRRLLNLVSEQELALQRFVAASTNSSNLPFVWYSTNCSSAVLLQKLKKSERKPLVKSINELKREARLRNKERQTVEEISLKPPANGLLVKSLVPVAHEVYAAISELLSCVSTVIKRSVLYYCKVCGDVHIGDPPHKIRTCNVAGSYPNKEHTWEIGGMQHAFPTVESFHLYDRIGRAVSHNEQLEVDRITALVELCVQAGVDIPEYPTRRRTCPIYNVAGRTIDFEKRFPKNFTMKKDINASGFWTERKKSRKDTISIRSDDLKVTAVRGMRLWDKMISGTEKLMEKYAVQTCGYCPEVQVGPKGHRVRNCYAYKHQMRDGQHAWQEATVDDLIPPVYVWHVQDVHSTKPLSDNLKRYYGVLPAVVELFAQAGADTPMRYTSLMKKDVVVPELYEMKLVV